MSARRLQSAPSCRKVQCPGIAVQEIDSEEDQIGAAQGIKQVL